MDLLEIHNRFELLVNKTTGQYFSHEEIDNFLDHAQMQEFELLLENSRELQNLRMGYPRSQKIHEDLLPFLDKTILSSPGANNIFGLPRNSQYATAFLYGDKNISIVPETEVAFTLDSTLVAPSEAYPIAVFQGVNTGGQKLVRIYPSTISSVSCFYLQRPDEPILAYTLSGRTVTYDSASSTQMGWNDGPITRIIHRALALAGIPLADQGLFQTNEDKQRTGQ